MRFIDKAERRAWEIVEQHKAVRASVASAEGISDGEPKLSSDVWLMHEIAKALREKAEWNSRETA